MFKLFSFAAVVVLAALVSAAVVFILFPIQHQPEAQQPSLSKNGSTNNRVVADQSKSIQQTNDKPDHSFRMRSAWIPKIDAVEKSANISIVLEDESKSIAGAVVLGCETASSPNIFLRLVLNNKYHLLDRKKPSGKMNGDELGTVGGFGGVEFSFPNLKDDWAGYSNIQEAEEYKILDIRGYGGTVRVRDEWKYGIQESLGIKPLFHLLHRDKNFDLSPDKGIQLTVREPATMLEADRKSFETIVSLCLDAVP